MLWFVTHAASTDNEAGVASGRRDCDLSARGRRQAAELPRRLAGLSFGEIWCSSLRRAAETAEIAFGRTHAVHVDARLDEVDYGDCSARPVHDLDRLRLRHLTLPFPGGESYAQRLALVEALVRDLPADVLIIGHRATWYSLEALLGGRSIADVVRCPFRWRPYWSYPFAGG